MLIENYSIRVFLLSAWRHWCELKGKHFWPQSSGTQRGLILKILSNSNSSPQNYSKSTPILLKSLIQNFWPLEFRDPEGGLVQNFWIVEPPVYTIVCKKQEVSISSQIFNLMHPASQTALRERHIIRDTPSVQRFVTKTCRKKGICRVFCYKGGGGVWKSGKSRYVLCGRSLISSLFSKMS